MCRSVVIRDVELVPVVVAIAVVVEAGAGLIPTTGFPVLHQQAPVLFGRHIAGTNGLPARVLDFPFSGPEVELPVLRSSARLKPFFDLRELWRLPNGVEFR